MDGTMIKTIVLVVYLLFMVWVGFFFFKRNETHSDYILGGRGLNSWVTALSAQASDMSGWLLIGLPGLAYASTLGAVEAIWTAIGLAVGTYLNWLFVAKRLRKYTQISKDSLTLPVFFHNRFRAPNPALRMISAIFILIFFSIYTASGFVAGAKLFNQAFGVNYTLAVVISVLVIVTYTFLGGFKAVCWTDLFQGLLMFFAILVVPFAAMNSLGGAGNTFSHIQQFPIFPDGTPKTMTWLGIFSAAAWGLGYFGQPHILARFMAIRSAKEVRPARIIAMIWVILALGGAVFVGLVGVNYLEAKGIAPLTGPDTEKIFMTMIDAMFMPLISGVFLAAILAAIMSTADSQLLVTASAVSEDFFKVFAKKQLSDDRLITISRVTVVAVAILGGLFALDRNSFVFSIVSYAWAGFGATFGPLVLFSLFWKRITYSGALAGVISGGLMTIIWKNLSLFTGGAELAPFFKIYEIVPAFIISCIFIVVVSLLSKAPAKEIADEFELVKTTEA